MCAITALIGLGFAGGLDHSEGEVHLEGALLFLAITAALMISIIRTSDNNLINTNKKEK